ncbi:MAG: ribosomal protein S18-alanine N-acetyltransferase [Cyanobacteria bacterium P01_A01_bin.84]
MSEHLQGQFPHRLSEKCPDAFNLEIKLLSISQIEALVQLDMNCFGGLWTKDGYKRELESPNSEILGCCPPLDSSQLMGMGCFWSILDEAHITILAVDSQYHSQGLGQALLYSLLKRAYKGGLKRATLEVRASNHRAISLYQKFGFKIAGKRPKYYKDNNEDALILWLGKIQYPEFQQTLASLLILVRDRLSQNGWNLVEY